MVRATELESEEESRLSLIWPFPAGASASQPARRTHMHIEGARDETILYGGLRTQVLVSEQD
jgi:hypothetical protein